MINTPYKLPNDWEWRKLVDVAEIVGGGTPKTHIDEYWNGDIIWLSPTDLGSIGEIVAVSDSAKKITKVGLNSSSAKLLPIGTILFSSRASIGKIGIAQTELATNQGFANFICKPVIYNRYLAFCFSRFWSDIENLSNSTTFKEVSKGSLKEFQIPLPPLEEQKRIVEKLDGLFAKADKAIALLGESIASASALLPSALNEVFGELNGKYKKEKLEKFDNKMSAGGTPLKSKGEYWNGEIEWFSSGELNNLYTETSKEKITEIGLKNSSAKLFQKGTLLIGMYDTAAMKMSILHTDASCNQAIVGIKPNENELSIFFLKYQLEHLKPKILEERQDVRQQNLNLSKIKNIAIEHPPLNIQTEVVAHLDTVRDKSELLSAKLRSQRDELIALKASLLERAFKGEL